jgi:hypothetical protein
MVEAADELDRLRGELDAWIAFRQGDTAVIERLQAFLDTMKSKAATREEAIYDRIRERERQAFDAGWKVAREPVPDDIVWLPIGTIKARLRDAYIAQLERKEQK